MALCLKKGCQDPTHGHYVDADLIRIGIVGSRRRNGFYDRRYVWSLLERIQEELHYAPHTGWVKGTVGCPIDPPRKIVVVSGGCPQGADKFAKDWATYNKYAGYIEHPIDKSTPIMHKGEYVKRAYARNRLIAIDSDALFCLVHQDRTGGTENTIKHTEELIREGHRKKIFLVDDSGAIYLSSGDQKIPCPADEPLPLV
jgi:hypothetical protein